MNIIKTKISDVKLNPNNPRLIKDDKFTKLVQSIKDFPEMLDIRPIVVNKDMIILGGNMRFKACKEAGLKEIPVIIADNLTEEQQREFLIKDNVSGGEWDWDLLSEWDTEQLEEWGLEVPSFNTETDYSEKNKELDLNDFEDQKYTIKLEFTEDDYNLVKERLQELGQTPEKILYDALISL
jgi:ParB-like chromosome segregation protein Spo0J